MIIQLIYNILLLPALFLLFLINPIKNFQKSTRQVKIQNNSYLVEVADTLFKRSKGLMFRKNLKKNEGMLFVFKNEGKPSFYNINVNFPLNFLWINKNREVSEITFLQKNTFKTTKPSTKIKYVLEFKSRTLIEKNSLIGTKIEVA